MLMKKWVLIPALLLTTLFLYGFSGSQGSSPDPVDTVADQTITISTPGQSSSIPCYQSHPPVRAYPGVDRGVIVFHGLTRNADDYYQRIQKSARSAGAQDNAAIFAPQFLIQADVEEHGLSQAFCFWSNRWNEGDLSLAQGSRAQAPRISSYDFIDRLIEILIDPQYFPDMKTIVLVGHSAGGQFVNRYAAGNRIGQAAADKGVRVKYVICNPSSYLYFDSRRLAPGTDDRFEVPGSADCPAFNDYKYGLEKLNRYMNKTGREKIVSQYGQREVVYLLGEKDNDPNDKYLATGCQAMLQGKTRLERGLVFYKYLKEIYGPDIYSRHKLHIVPGVAHSSGKMFNSAQGLETVFDYSGK